MWKPSDEITLLRLTSPDFQKFEDVAHNQMIDKMKKELRPCYITFTESSNVNWNKLINNKPMINKKRIETIEQNQSWLSQSIMDFRKHCDDQTKHPTLKAIADSLAPLINDIKNLAKGAQSKADRNNHQIEEIRKEMSVLWDIIHKIVDNAGLQFNTKVHSGTDIDGESFHKQEWQLVKKETNKSKK